MSDLGGRRRVVLEQLGGGVVGLEPCCLGLGGGIEVGYDELADTSAEE